MASPLGPTQTLVLLALDGLDGVEPPPTAIHLAGEVNAEAIEHVGAAAVVAHPVTTKATAAALTKLARRGLVERCGKSWLFPRLTCWAITPAGRDALAKEDDRG